MNDRLKIEIADLERDEHRRAVVEMTAMYAMDIMGNGGPLDKEVLDKLVPALQAMPTTIIFLAFIDNKPVGIATCFRGFSTFAAKQLINIHDFAVSPNYRGHGIGQALLQAVEQRARDLGCVKVTLEVQEHNRRARKVYAAAGFAQAQYGDTNGGSLFYSKKL